MLNTLYFLISVCAAIATAAFVYKFAIEANFKTIATIPLCLLAAVVAGNVWLPATLIFVIIFIAERNVVHK
jgi:hypothetical protein